MSTEDVLSTEPGVCIIGFGSRGLGVLERIVTLTAAPEWGARPFTVDVVDPRCDAIGIHDPAQPDYLLLNTTCSQVSPFPEEATVGDTVGDRGPNLYEWVRERGLRLAEDGYTLGPEGREIRADDYLPRRILGEYLSWFLQRVVDRAPGHLVIRFHRTEAVELTVLPDGNRRVVLDDGGVLTAPYVFLTTGHTPPAALPEQDRPLGEHRRVREIYPPVSRFAGIRPGQTVALAGTGLSGMDALAALTLGRGGRYTTADGTLRYVPSGAEPRILLYSRTGLPFRARPRANRQGPLYEPLVFTAEAVDRLRADAPEDGLSLHGDLLPLVRTEMRIAFHLRCAGLLGGDGNGRAEDRTAEDRTADALREAVAAGRLDSELDRLDAEHRAAFGLLDPEEVLFPEPGDLSGSGAYQDWYGGRLAEDLEQAELGLAGSPLKAALEVLRDRRELIRRAVDFAGLDEKSHDEFYGSFTAVLNRSVTGPQLDRHQELLALLRAGVAAVPLGPEPEVAWDEAGDCWRLSSTRLAEPYSTTADWLCHATSGQPDVERTGSRLLAGLVRTGTIRRHRAAVGNSRGVDLTRGLHPVGSDGAADERMWVLGPLSEGTTFYNHYVPSPGGFSRALSDAHRSVVAMLAAAGEAASEAGGETAAEVSEEVSEKKSPTETSSAKVAL
ncbi:FAD/NAD(P)-binding protein [Streptomyces sp. VNUA116]|uniref:FAD/NAD(P)-binding protein n=1 Tax=Streptomyces sp. VNUA116 TaxID=3062449 RepID=UPI0026751426|nr:FAD/NAD(P)-binding protein [Streptomyces sp. VNUA116]WKU46109.1 FAD/NAD(P)-binding protein [Streptomyces sp. VNUA116]